MSDEIQIQGLLQQAQMILRDLVEHLVNGVDDMALIRTAIIAGRMASDMTGDLRTPADMSSVMGVLLARQIVEDSRPFEIGDALLELAVVKSREVVDEDIETTSRALRLSPDLTPVTLLQARLLTQFEDASKTAPDNVVRSMALSAVITGAEALLRLAKLNATLPGLLEAYGASMEASGVMRNRGLMQECGSHRATALEVREQILKTVRDGD